MSVWHVEGGNRLTGSVTVQGAKNAVLPIMAASVLAPGETELLNVPELRDVDTTIRILRGLGCSVEREGDAVYIDSRAMAACEIPHRLMRELRSSVIFLGALLARCGRAKLSMPGGCELGPRPIDLHLMALRALGAQIDERGGELICSAPDGLHGAGIALPMPSVGATENAMLAACAAEGETVIMNAAKEPEISELQSFLQKLGADVTGAGSATVRVRGRGLEPFTVGHRIMPDRIVSSTLLCACAAAGGDIELRGVVPGHFSTVLHSLSECGCDIMSNSSCVRLRSGGNLRAPMPVITGPYPGFPTDAQPLLLAACLKAKGTSVFVENVFLNRFRFTEELQRLGARIHTEGRVAVVTGVDVLHAAPTVATDLRGGAALIIAALSAEGETDILDSGHVVRGYENFDRRLTELGAKVYLEEQ
ncbi:MAG TPA: UDP-N-acetylglucosamine 1-carboxyvinyltransferase [Candidatus Scatomorpha gallistercoris]|nr:UDP-N-acetylglucosamine 1-carboxyvinyltransferase [Candidatus Scatomorpha gallistercoris]